MVEIKTQPIKPIRIPIHYPCIICYNAGCGSRECPRKIEVQNMFRTKHANFNATIAPKPPKLDNVQVNVIVVVTTHS
jgi:hypothetical protein